MGRTHLDRVLNNSFSIVAEIAACAATVFCYDREQSGLAGDFRISMTTKAQSEIQRVERYAEMFSAMGTAARLRILRLLLAAHPNGMVPGDLQSELGIPASTLSHHLDKLKHEDLVSVRREGTYLWYSANTEALQDLLAFLFAECCTRSKAIKPDVIVNLCR